MNWVFFIYPTSHPFGVVGTHSLDVKYCGVGVQVGVIGCGGISLRPVRPHGIASSVRKQRLNLGHPHVHCVLNFYSWFVFNCWTSIILLLIFSDVFRFGAFTTSIPDLSIYSSVRGFHEASMLDNSIWVFLVINHCTKTPVVCLWYLAKILRSGEMIYMGDT